MKDKYLQSTHIDYKENIPGMWCELPILTPAMNPRRLRAFPCRMRIFFMIIIWKKKLGSSMRKPLNIPEGICPWPFGILRSTLGHHAFRLVTDCWTRFTDHFGENEFLHSYLEFLLPYGHGFMRIICFLMLLSMTMLSMTMIKESYLFP